MNKEEKAHLHGIAKQILESVESGEVIGIHAVLEASNGGLANVHALSDDSRIKDLVDAMTANSKPVH